MANVQYGTETRLWALFGEFPFHLAACVRRQYCHRLFLARRRTNFGRRRFSFFLYRRRLNFGRHRLLPGSKPTRLGPHNWNEIICFLSHSHLLQQRILKMLRNLLVNCSKRLYSNAVKPPPRESNIADLKSRTKVPLEPIIFSYPKHEQVEIDSNTILLLERLSLVDLDSKEALQTLQDSIEFADRITHIDTTGVEPLYTVLEHEYLQTREDTITDGNIKEDVLKNASIVEEDYFVAPPGNIPLEQEDKKF